MSGESHSSSGRAASYDAIVVGGGHNGLVAAIELDVLGTLVTLSEREAEELRDVAGADAGRSTARRDLSLLLARGLRTKSTVALSRAEARELAELLPTTGPGSNLALLREALLEALGDSQP